MKVAAVLLWVAAAGATDVFAPCEAQIAEAPEAREGWRCFGVLPSPRAKLRRAASRILVARRQISTSMFDLTM